MKKVNLFAMLSAAVVLMTGVTSCSDKDDAMGGAGEKATINIGVTAPETSRSVTAGSLPTDAVTNFTAFIVDGDGTMKTGFSNDGTGLTGANAIAATTAAKKIYVVANAGNLTSTITSESALLSYLADLNGTGSQATVRWATGEVALTSTDFTQSGGDWVASKSIALTFIAARITLTIENGMTGYNAAATDGSLVLKSVAVMNARGQSKLFNGTGTNLIPASYGAGKKFYEGLANNSFAYYPAAGSFTMAASLLSNPIAAGDFASKYYYYVFENDATAANAFPTVITIVAEFDGKTIYYPVHLASYEQFASGSASNFITRGNSYDINIKLTVDPTIGGGDPGGPTDPTNPVVNAKVSVSVTLNSWVPVVLDKEF